MKSDSLETPAQRRPHQFQATDQFITDGAHVAPHDSTARSDLEIGASLGAYSLAMRQLFQSPERDVN